MNRQELTFSTGAVCQALYSLRHFPKNLFCEFSEWLALDTHDGALYTSLLFGEMFILHCIDSVRIVGASGVRCVCVCGAESKAKAYKRKLLQTHAKSKFQEFLFLSPSFHIKNGFLVPFT